MMQNLGRILPVILFTGWETVLPIVRKAVDVVEDEFFRGKFTRIPKRMASSNRQGKVPSVFLRLRRKRT